MKTRAALVFALLLVAAPAFAQKITIDYAHDYDFDKVKTFQYIDTKDSDSQNQLMDARIRDAIIRELEEGGLKQVESDPDIFVTYHITTKDNTVFTTTGFGYGGWGPGWGTWGGVGMTGTTTTSSTYTVGTLIIDAYEPADKKLVWRGTGTVTVKSKPEKQMQQVDKILAKMGAKWDSILAKQGK